MQDIIDIFGIANAFCNKGEMHAVKIIVYYFRQSLFPSFSFAISHIYIQIVNHMKYKSALCQVHRECYINYNNILAT